MTLEYLYPEYGIAFTPEHAEQCRLIAQRLLDEIGFVAAHEGLLSALRGKPGLRFEGSRVFFAPELTREYMERYTAKLRDSAATSPTAPADEWSLKLAGYSMNVLDLETDEQRLATCDDLRDMIKLANSLGIGGCYPCMPQDLPPLMRAIACFKICWESSDAIQPYDYQQPEQTSYIYRMHQVMGKRFDITLTVPSAMCVDPKDLDIFLQYHETWRANRDIDFRILDYGMLGIMKPISATGCAAMTLTETLAVHMLLNLYDSEVDAPVFMIAGVPTDLRNACWAFGSPRRHLLRYLETQIAPRMCGYEQAVYFPPDVLLETSSPVPDAQAAMEKMANGLLGAMQGARSFGYAGVLCVDDVFSGAQLVMDVEMVDYIRETVESFNAHPDVLDATGLFEECRDVALGNETFISHPNTARKLRNVLPSPKRIVREKLSSWMHHRGTLLDRAKEEALERIATAEPFCLDDARQSELDRVYEEAEKKLGS